MPRTVIWARSEVQYAASRQSHYPGILCRSYYPKVWRYLLSLRYYGWKWWRTRSFTSVDFKGFCELEHTTDELAEYTLYMGTGCNEGKGWQILYVLLPTLPNLLRCIWYSRRTLEEYFGRRRSRFSARPLCEDVHHPRRANICGWWRLRISLLGYLGDLSQSWLRCRQTESGHEIILGYHTHPEYTDYWLLRSSLRI